MDKLTISINDIIYNNFFIALISSLIAILLLFIDRCIFVKKNNYITYIKLFSIIFITVYLALSFKDMNTNTNDIDLDLSDSPFNK
tara:strand:- start:38 stop:292 length:255 start_codon:yes stop_codon:yes gene_type:complete